jgi:hypothetical protein
MERFENGYIERASTAKSINQKLLLPLALRTGQVKGAAKLNRRTGGIRRLYASIAGYKRRAGAGRAASNHYRRTVVGNCHLEPS